MVVLYTQSRASQEWREFGRTEVIDNTLNPDFVRKFVLDYFFEEKQNLRFDVYNVDSKTNISKPVSRRPLAGSGEQQHSEGFHDPPSPWPDPRPTLLTLSHQCPFLTVPLPSRPLLAPTEGKAAGVCGARRGQVRGGGG